MLLKRDTVWRRVLGTLAATLLLSVVAAASIRRTATSASAGASITVDVYGPATPINSMFLGTNLPAWLTAERFQDGVFQTRTQASGVSLIRMPGGSWCNYYDWLACERDGQGIDPEAECYWPWAAKPTDFLDFLRDTDLEGMYTVNMNGTAKEAAALVAFFNGSVDDERTIGVDVHGRDWGKVGDWAQLRSDHGNSQPIDIQYWEIGNEIYGGTPESGTDCTPWGWEDVWTCDGTEYVNGIGSGANRHEGFLEFREAMRDVDPSILVGAVGVAYQDSWSNWGNEVIAAAGEEMDFYIVHHYGFSSSPMPSQDVLAEPFDAWPALMTDLRAAFQEHANGRDVPVAVTEYNLFAFQDLDDDQLMTRMLNAFYMADTVGQMIVSGVDMSVQYDLANGQAGNGTDYGLLHADTYARYPQYYAYVLWSRFGDVLLPVTNSLPAETTLSLYAGRADGDTLSILAMNKTAGTIEASLQFNGVSGFASGMVDVVKAASLEAQSVTFNGKADPADDLSDALSTSLPDSSNPLSFTFEPFSITLLRLDLEESGPQEEHSLLFPLIVADNIQANNSEIEKREPDDSVPEYGGAEHREGDNADVESSKDDVTISTTSVGMHRSVSWLPYIVSVLVGAMGIYFAARTKT